MSEDAELRDRMGRYIAAELPTWGELLGVSWPVEVEWTERRLRASLRRGELVLSAETYEARWWLPATKARAGRWMTYLAGILGAKHGQYATADETGRVRVPAWRDADGALRLEAAEGAEAVELVLEPGVRLGAEGGGTLPVLHREGSGQGLTLERAVGEGWASVASEGDAGRPLSQP